MNIRSLKENTKTAADYLRQQGVEVGHAQLLEAISRALGSRNWSTLRATLKQGESSVVPTVSDWTPGQRPMTEAQFVSFKGSRCPVCGSHEVESEDLEADGPDAWDESSCGECNATWRTSYSVCGYYNLEQGEGSTALREDVIEAIVDDVRERAAKYHFAVHSAKDAEPLAWETDSLYNLGATQAEVNEAVNRLL